MKRKHCNNWNRGGFDDAFVCHLPEAPDRHFVMRLDCHHGKGRREIEPAMDAQKNGILRKMPAFAAFATRGPLVWHAFCTMTSGGGTGI
ncbi:MAG: hypothetical protein MJ025_04215 [Victivallaceae bacterium]|nr:hypothetical protein [Victivallaceae bacterium]